MEQHEALARGHQVISGGKVFIKCGYCQQIVQMNKIFLGGLHVCLSPEERARIDGYRNGGNYNVTNK